METQILLYRAKKGDLYDWLEYASCIGLNNQRTCINKRQLVLSIFRDNIDLPEELKRFLWSYCNG